jgi:hypothetical protein
MNTLHCYIFINNNFKTKLINANINQYVVKCGVKNYCIKTIDENSLSEHILINKETENIVSKKKHQVNRFINFDVEWRNNCDLFVENEKVYSNAQNQVALCSYGKYRHLTYLLDNKELHCVFGSRSLYNNIPNGINSTDKKSLVATNIRDMTSNGQTAIIDNNYNLYIYWYPRMEFVCSNAIRVFSNNEGIFYLDDFHNLYFVNCDLSCKKIISEFIMSYVKHISVGNNICTFITSNNDLWMIHGREIKHSWPYTIPKKIDVNVQDVSCDTNMIVYRKW